MLPDVERDLGWYGGEFLEVFLPFCRTHSVSRIVAEAPILVAHHDKQTGRKQFNVHEVRKLFGLFAFASLLCRELGLPQLEEAPRSSVVRHFIGIDRNDDDWNRRYIKGAIVLQVQAKNWGVQGEDVADALATLDWWSFQKRFPVKWNNQPAAGKLFAPKGVRINDGNKRAAERLVRSAMSFDRERT